MAAAVAGGQRTGVSHAGRPAGGTRGAQPCRSAADRNDRGPHTRWGRRGKLNRSGSVRLPPRLKSHPRHPRPLKVLLFRPRPIRAREIGPQSPTGTTTLFLKMETGSHRRTPILSTSGDSEPRSSKDSLANHSESLTPNLLEPLRRSTTRMSLGTCLGRTSPVATDQPMA
jgi:hypothetical protein